MVKSFLLDTGFLCFLHINSQTLKHSFSGKVYLAMLYWDQTAVIKYSVFSFWTTLCSTGWLPWIWQISRTKRSGHFSFWELALIKISSCLASLIRFFLHSLRLNQFQSLYLLLSGTPLIIRNSVFKKTIDLRFLHICFPNEAMISSCHGYFP